MIIDQCPFCGSAALTERSEQSHVSVPYGPAVPYESMSYVCGKCHEETIADEEKREAAIQEANAQSVKAMLEHLKKEGISTAYFERALRLPQRTAARWKYGNFSAPAIALLRCIRTFPRLLDIADDEFRVPPELEPGRTASAASIYQTLSEPLVSTETASPRVSLRSLSQSP
jgi:hypothetical protein